MHLKYILFILSLTNFIYVSPLNPYKHGTEVKSDNKNEDNNMYMKDFIDDCLSIYSTTKELSCPQSDYCLKWRAKQFCIYTVNNYLLIKSLMNFCTIYKDHDDCVWYNTDHCAHGDDSIKKWLGSDFLTMS